MNPLFSVVLPGFLPSAEPGKPCGGGGVRHHHLCAHPDQGGDQQQPHLSEEPARPHPHRAIRGKNDNRKGNNMKMIK